MMALLDNNKRYARLVPRLQFETSLADSFQLVSKYLQENKNI